MEKYVCTVCGYVFDEAKGIPEQGLKPGTKWEDIPEDWTCPLCGAAKAEFKSQAAGAAPEARLSIHQAHEEQPRELSFGELSALCSNLSKGCEKQYRSREAEWFNQLADYYRSKCPPEAGKHLTDLLKLIEADISIAYPQANAVVSGAADRGALRALVWGEKVTRILSSLISRYEKQKNTLLANTDIYVCEICGFVTIGDKPPEICPVCKVPSLKIGKIQREAV
jgi:rubredoxin